MVIPHTHNIFIIILGILRVYNYMIKMSDIKINLAIIFTAVTELIDIFDFQLSVEIYIYIL